MRPRRHLRRQRACRPRRTHRWRPDRGRLVHGQTAFHPGPAHTTIVSALSGGSHLVEIWLPHNETLELIELRADAAIEPDDSARPRWMHHGSSISHGSNALAPSEPWPAVAARRAGVGAVYVRAVLAGDDGWTPLSFDGAGELSTAVHVNGQTVSTGAAAWRLAADDPVGFVLSPVRAGTGQVSVAGAAVEVADLVAATLRQVAAEADRMAGAPVGDVRLVVPAGWDRAASSGCGAPPGRPG